MALEQVLERHADKWIPEPNTGCFLWLGALGNGRPQVRKKGKTDYVSRLVCNETYGPAPTFEHIAAHATPNGCVGGLCIAPGHLRWATQHENHMDMTPEQRSARVRGLRHEAMAARKDIYFTGKPCRYGHIAQRYIWGGCTACVKAKNARRWKK